MLEVERGGLDACGSAGPEDAGECSCFLLFIITCVWGEINIAALKRTVIIIYHHYLMIPVQLYKSG